jgi:hypothetical protein
MKKIILIILISLTVQVSYGQKKNNLISWEEGKLLTWDDFKGRATGASPYEATTYGALDINFELVPETQNKLRFILQVNFDKKKSWVKKKKGTDKLLKHEQLHFDIFELYARMFIKKLEEENALSGEKYGGKVKKIFNKNFKDLMKFQQQYDKETNHSKNEEQQKEWIIKVKDLLKEYKGYTKREIVFEVN